MRPSILLAIALLASWFTGCRSVEAPFEIVTLAASEAPPSSMPDPPDEIATLHWRLDRLEKNVKEIDHDTDVRLRRLEGKPPPPLTFDETENGPSPPKSQPKEVHTQPAYEGDCANGQCGPRRLAPRLFGRFR